jgi:TolA-binding protein
MQSLKFFRKKFLVLSFIFALCALRFAPVCLAQEASKEEESLFVAKKAFSDGFYEVSLGLLERFLKNYPESSKLAEADLLIGQCYFHQNKYLDALKKFEELLASPASRDIKDAVFYWIAEVHFKGNNFNRASQYYKMIIDEFPASSYAMHAYYSVGWCLFQERLFSEALKYFKIVEEKFPKEPQFKDVSVKIVESLYNLKDYLGIKERVKSYLGLYPNDAKEIPYLYFYMAEADYYLGNFLEAVDAYSKVLSGSNDEKVQALSRLGIGWGYIKLKRYQEANDMLLAINSVILEKNSQDILTLGKGIVNFEMQKFMEAKNVYNELLGSASDPLILIQAYLGKADVLYNLNEYKDAISVYKEALEKFSSGVIPQESVDKLHYGLAWSFLKEGEFKNAIDEFQKIAKNTEDKTVKVATLCQIGDAYQDSANYKKAEEVYDGILRDYPDSFYNDYVQYQLGLVMLKASNYDGAIAAFLSLKNNFPDSKLLDDASYSLGLTYFQKEDYNSSKEIFKKFDEEFKNSNLRSQGLYLLGTSLYNLAKFSEAIEVFKDIIRLYGQDADLMQKAEYEIADCYYRMGDEKEAMTRLNALRSKYPDSSLTVEVMWWLGEYYYRHNDLNLARRYLSSLIQDFPKSNLIPDAYYFLGLTYLEESKYQEAVNNFQKVMEMGRSDLAGQAAITIADIYSREEKIDLALLTYKEVIKDYENLDNLVCPKLADLNLKIGNYDEALVYYHKSLEIVPVRQIADIQFKIAEVMQMQKNIDGAIEEYLKVTYLYSENNDLAVKSLLRLAAIYEDKEDFKEAANIYKRIKSMNVPESKYAQERIDWIKVNVK